MPLLYVPEKPPPRPQPQVLKPPYISSYGASLLAESVINDSATPLAQCRRPATASSDPALAAFAQLAALRLNAGRTLISLFDGKRQYVVAEATQTTAIELDTGGGDDHDDDEGRPPGAGDAPLLLSGTAVPRHRGTCEHVLDLPAVAQDPGDDLLPISVVPDLARDDRFAGRSLFGPAPPSGFYAGVPLRSPQGIDIGVCCVLDDEPRRGLGAPDRRFLRHIGRLVMSHLQSRVSTESYRRNERMVRGLGSMVEGGGSIARWRGEPNPKSFHDVDGTEGSLNLRQQRIQEFHRRRYSPATPRPVVTPVQPEPTAEDDAEGERPTDSTDTVDTISEFKSFTSYPGKPKDEYQAVKALFARTANIIRESIEIEGALFLDAAIESFGGLVSNDVESQQRSEGSSGEESVATDDSILQQEYCRVLGFSTSTNSSINGDTTPEEHTMVPDTFLEKILRRYREGQVFNFDDDGAIIWAGKYLPHIPMPRGHRPTFEWPRGPHQHAPAVKVLTPPPSSQRLGGKFLRQLGRDEKETRKVLGQSTQEKRLHIHHEDVPRRQKRCLDPPLGSSPKPLVCRRFCLDQIQGSRLQRPGRTLLP